MVSTKRQIKNSSERYGGFTPSTDEPTTAYSTLVVNTDVVAPNEPSYDIIDTRPSAKTIAPEIAPELAPTVYTNRPSLTLPENTKRDAENLMPSFKTRKYEAEAPKENYEVKSGVSVKQKVVVAVASLVCLVLAIVVVVTSIMISQTTAAVSALESDIAAKQAVIASQLQDLAEIDDEAAIRDRAEELGMIVSTDAQQTITVALSPTEDITIPEHTNGFDAFCDWLSGLLLG